MTNGSAHPIKPSPPYTLGKSKRTGPSLHDVLADPERYPEESERLRQTMERASAVISEQFAKSVGPTLETLRAMSANVTEEALKSVQIPAFAELSRNLSKQLDAIVKMAVPALPDLTRVEAARMFALSPGRISQIYSSPIRNAPALPVDPVPVEAVIAGPGSASVDLVSALERLVGLHEKGALTDNEFVTAKARVLESS